MKFIIVMVLLIASCTSDDKRSSDANIVEANVKLSTCTELQRAALKESGLDENSSLANLLDVVLQKHDAVPRCNAKR